MSDTVITVEDDTPPPATVIVEPPADVDESAGEAAAAAATAVADALARADEADTVAEIVTDARTAELERELADLKARLAYDEGVRAGEAAAVVDDTPTVEVDDEVIAPQTHPWFRPMNEWRDK